MKEKMPLTSTTPVPTPSAAIAADAHREGPSTTEDPTPAKGRVARQGEGRPPETHIAMPAAEPGEETVPGVELDSGRTPKMRARDVSVYYADKQALNKVSIDIHADRVTAFIGPSGCGKSTFLRTLNRMNDTIPTARVTGRIELDGEDINSPDMDVVQLRARVGMVFQRPNPFPKSIYENVAYGPRIHGVRNRDQIDEIVERSLRQAALWDEVKDVLKKSAFDLSGGQQQRLCIARALAVEPEVVLMDEPCSALDPISTFRIEELMVELQQSYTILLVTHNMYQASRV